ncbi:aminotransferase class I/II-fold pyridoxal phosphate-dependent enzyme [Thermanaerosceptrum fracticalcis]|uniref:Aminotransferase class I/II-fold pyridoxal phosphate-dependent enzyme n=1 Tax=Thermanaerosceptrum fracticalcis TaxID=1712410 RepID=A0A7G6E2Q6_THEFR|nr:aminotransferase class I/II-fold pyridoxal phosphate-dependent enzyme [Thermanaerosceptrum fracticalcis]QNB46360.1 aminotransferase class I/II-fold pyridoxal phosphate-dependent enzyme [Thermanaerosceptrum fracticalcis]
MCAFSMAASHARGKGEVDAVFSVLKKANDAVARLGKDKVVNASIGAIFDDEEKFVSLSAVNEYYREMPAEELMNYAAIAGLPDFLEAAVDFTFRGYKPENTYIKAVATPGGTGAVRHVFYNYVEEGQKALIPDWFWGPYRTIADEHLRGVDTYAMFDENYEFTLNSLKEKTQELLKVQDNLVIVFNTPAHNPTGYTMSMGDWQETFSFLKKCAEDKSKKIVLLLDIAYIDYAGTVEETRGFMKLFSTLPENILVTIAFSMSKSFLMYGMRSGALIGVSTSQDVAQEFFDINAYSNRGVWSNGTRGAQKLLADVAKNPELQAKIDAEREQYTKLIKDRAAIFMKEAKEVGLKTLPFRAGFFITVPASDPKKVAEKLAQDNIFVVPLKKGVRFAICSVPTHKMSGLAAKTKQAME